MQKEKTRFAGRAQTDPMFVLWRERLKKKKEKNEPKRTPEKK